MSLAMYAASINEDDNQNSKEDTISKKRTSNNRTQKRFPKENQFSDKVNSVLNSIHSHNDDNDNDQYSDFKPLPPPISAGVEQTKSRENLENMQNGQQNNGQSQPHNQTHYSPQYSFYNQNNQLANENSQKKHNIPDYASMYKKSSFNLPYYQAQNSSDTSQTSNNQNYDTSSPNVLIDKLNYMIKLLEEQQDEKTNNVTEEVVLYCFLGIFVIFIVDSFVRVGKYVR